MDTLKFRRILVGMVAVVASAAILACVDNTPTPTPTPEPTATPLPDVAFGVTAQSVMAPLEVGFNVEMPSADASYSWDFGDGTSATGASASHTYLDAGQFKAVLRADYDGAVLTAERAITVQPGAAGWLVLNSYSAELLSGDSFQFEAEAFDELGNPVDASAVKWSSDPAAGTIDGDGKFTAGPEVGQPPRGVGPGRAPVVGPSPLPVLDPAGEQGGAVDDQDGHDGVEGRLQGAGDVPEHRPGDRAGVAEAGEAGGDARCGGEDGHRDPPAQDELVGLRSGSHRGRG